MAPILTLLLLLLLLELLFSAVTGLYAAIVLTWAIGLRLTGLRR